MAPYTVHRFRKSGSQASGYELKRPTRGRVARLVTLLVAPLLVATVATLPSSAQDPVPADPTESTLLRDGGLVVLRNVDLDRYLASDGDGVNDNVSTSTNLSSRSVWRLTENSDDTWGLRNVATGGWLDGDGANRDWNVDQSTQPRSDDRWRVEELNNNEFEFINVARNRRLDADRGHQDWDVDLAVARRGDRKWFVEPGWDDTQCRTPGGVPGLVASASRFDFDMTWAQLVAAVENNPNLNVFRVVDHAAAAQSVGLRLDPNRVLIFGNPAIGTPLMTDQRSVGLDLPQKMQVWEDGETGAVCVAFTAPSYLQETHELGALPQLPRIDAALRTLASTATGRDVVGQPVRGAMSFTSARSANDFETTWTRLLAAIGESPASVSYTVDHGENSGGVLEPTRLVAFGDSTLATPLMQTAASAGVDLPLRMLVWAAGDNVFVDSISPDGFALRHGLDSSSPSVVAFEALVNNFTNAAITAPPPEPEPGPCVVGDECPPQRLVDHRGLCVTARSFGDVGASLIVGGGCDRRARAFHEPSWQVTLADNGTLAVNGFCLTRQAADPVPILQVCEGSAAQAWVVNDDGSITDGAAACLVARDGDGRELAQVACDGTRQQRWGFIGIGTFDAYDVRQVYITAVDSAPTNRAAVLQRAVEIVRNDWVESAATWQIGGPPTVIELDQPCASLTSLADVRQVATRELSLRGEFSLNAKYNVVAECPTPGEAANATRGIAVYAQAIFNGTDMQIGLDPDNSADGTMGEVGVFGHELGHTFGLPHENCQIGGWQGGFDEEASFIVRGLPGAATRGPMCNGAFYPNVDALADYQRDIVFDQSCRWIAECSASGEYAADGRPFGCGLTGAPTMRWDSTVPGRSLGVEIRRYTVSEGAVQVSGPFTWSRGGTLIEDLVRTEDNYFSIGLTGATPAERRTCGKWMPPMPG